MHILKSVGLQEVHTGINQPDIAFVNISMKVWWLAAPDVQQGVPDDCIFDSSRMPVRNEFLTKMVVSEV